MKADQSNTVLHRMGQRAAGGTLPAGGLPGGWGSLCFPSGQTPAVLRYSTAARLPGAPGREERCRIANVFPRTLKQWLGPSVLTCVSKYGEPGSWEMKCSVCLLPLCPFWSQKCLHQQFFRFYMVFWDAAYVLSQSAMSHGVLDDKSSPETVSGFLILFKNTLQHRTLKVCHLQTICRFNFHITSL